MLRRISVVWRLVLTGTTNSLVATVRSGQAETLADHEGRHLLPSVVHYQQQGHSVGYDARTNAALDTANTISSVKRLMGRSLADIQQRYRICLINSGQRKRPADD